MKPSPRRLAAIAGAVLLFGPMGVAVAGQSASPLVQAEIDTIANHLNAKPGMAIDLSGVSGEYCLNAGLGKGGHMTHYAIDTAKTEEDIVDFVRAESFIEAGMDADKLPRFPGALQSMKPNRWYYLPAGAVEPHHGKRFPFALLVRATNVK